MLLSLNIETPHGGAYNLAVGGADVELGRSAACAVRLPYPALSSRHLRFAQHDGHWSLQDLDSKNGTLVDGRPVAPHQEVPVADGTLIQIGELRIITRLDDETSDGFTLTENGTMLRKLLAESVGPSGATLQSEDGEQISVPDFASDLRPTDPPEFRIDRRGHGFWVKPLVSSIELDGEPLKADGSALRDGQRLRGQATWLFRDPLERHVRALEDEQPDPPVEPDVAPTSARGRLEVVAMGVGALAFVAAAVALLAIFEVI